MIAEGGDDPQQIDASPFLETQYVFIDTSIFVAKNFAWQKPIFQSLSKLSKNGQIKVILTDIVVSECRNKISEFVKASASALKLARKNAQILYNMSSENYHILFKKVDIEIVQNDLFAQLDGFVASVKANIIQATKIDAEFVFSRYFQSLPPFGLGKKKAEFPDSFNIEALKRFALNEKVEIYVVSTDNDLRKCCTKSSRLIWAGEIEAVVSRVQYESDLMDRLDQFVESNQTAIQDWLEEHFPRIPCYITDREGEADNLKFESYDLHTLYLIEKNGSELEIEIGVNVRYSVDVGYEDYERAIYDREERAYFGLEYTRSNIIRYQDAKILVECSIDPSGGENLKMGHMCISEPSSIDIEIDDF